VHVRRTTGLLANKWSEEIEVLQPEPFTSKKQARAYARQTHLDCIEDPDTYVETGIVEVRMRLSN
jgi:hypothetical protein